MKIALSSIFVCALSGNFARAFVSTNTALRSISSSTRLSMSLKEGDKLPMDAVFSRFVDGKPANVSAADLFAGKKVVVCGVPGALTPTCSEKHLPGFIEAVDELKSKGVDTVACITVNDPFVVNAWKKTFESGDKIEFLADGGASFAKSIGHEFDTGEFDGVVQKLGVEEGGAFTDISDVKSILNSL